MSEFDERKYCCPNTCRKCKHGVEVHLELSDDYVIKNYCLLGLSPEEISYVNEQLPRDYISDGMDFPERFCALMNIEDPCDILYSPRRTEVTDCCDKFEGCVE